MVKTIDPWDAVPEAVPARYTTNETGQRGRQQKKLLWKGTETTGQAATESKAFIRRRLQTKLALQSV
jgi:hypothetical protein